MPTTVWLGNALSRAARQVRRAESGPVVVRTSTDQRRPATSSSSADGWREPSAAVSVPAPHAEPASSSVGIGGGGGGGGSQRAFV